ncbi:hypothetical protein FLACOL_00244 [Flavobacterium columnare]|uniref:Uncharacterized protein n=2 Tax=Flavobacterium TaxID=237 RepID=A0ABW8PRA9_9FLAO|nr:hypothetical protein [Flavobacterium columnare]SPE76266.1 hypothetical protein FLACOL_00244 [Flavobacterium columnare]
MNIIDVLQNNLFLNQLYPKGIKDFFISKIELNYFNKVTVILNCRDKPEIAVKKWGEWGKNFNVVTIEFSVQFLKNINILNWENSSNFNCNCSIKKEDLINVRFYGDDWDINFSTNNGMLFQKADVYLEEPDTSDI